MFVNRYAAALLASIAVPLAACQASADNHSEAKAETDALKAAVEASTRSADNVERDQYRRPYETLSFLGVEPTDTVVEIWPGGGWYTEVLAPYLKDDGKLILVASENGLRRTRDKATADADTYGKIEFAQMEPTADAIPFAEGSADAVLTFRNVHNWAMGDESYADKMFEKMFMMLKPGGTLGVVDHRLPEDRPDEDMKSSGYMKQSAVIAMAEAAGFELVEASEINANPKDTADHPRGVWTLPPRLRLEDQDREKYVAIGESDRMTLKFRKPE